MEGRIGRRLMGHTGQNEMKEGMQVKGRRVKNEESKVKIVCMGVVLSLLLLLFSYFLCVFIDILVY